LLFKLVEHHRLKPLDLIHSDLWQSPVLSTMGYRCCCFLWMIFHVMHGFIHSSENQIFYQFFVPLRNWLKICSILNKMFQSDGGREFDNTSLGAHFLERGVYFRKSCPETQPQNGVAEHKHRHLNEIARSFLVEAHMPATFWVEAIQTVVFVANRLRLPTPNLQGHSSFEKLFHRLPAYNFLKSFGCPLLPKFFSHFCE